MPARDLLNRYRVVKPYRGFESLRLRNSMFSGVSCILKPLKWNRRYGGCRSWRRFPPAQNPAQCVFGPFALRFGAMPAPSSDLALRPTVIGGDKLDDDWQVIWGGIPIGRILKAPGIPVGLPNWSWGVI